MAFPAGSASATETASGDEAINSLLGADLATETETATGEDTSAADRGTTVEDETETGVEETEEQPTTDEGEGAEESGEEEQAEEEETGEEEFNVADLETDFAESAYKAAAAHYSKTLGIEIDLNNPKDRALLRENMLRGQEISRLNAERQPDEEEAEETTAAESETEKPPVFKTQDEYFQHQIKNAVEYAKTNVNPVVLKEAIYPMMGAMAKFFWGDKAAQFMAGKKPEDVMELAQAMDTVMTLKGQEVAGGILANVGKQVETTFPYFTKSQEWAQNEAVIDEVSAEPGYENVLKLIDSGVINRVIANELKGALFNKDPHKNKVAIVKMAVKLARNERVDPKMLAEASKRGREAERTRSARVAAGRTPPGSSNRGAAGSTNGKFISTLVQNSSSRAARLFRDVGRQK